MTWGGKRGNKYGAKKTAFAGRTFDSKKESQRYAELLLLERGGHIGELECQPKFAIVVNDVHICFVIPDFRYRDVATGHTVIEDVKSPATAKNREFLLKKKLLEVLHDVEVRIL